LFTLQFTQGFEEGSNRNPQSFEGLPKNQNPRNTENVRNPLPKNRNPQNPLTVRNPPA